MGFIACDTHFYNALVKLTIFHFRFRGGGPGGDRNPRAMERPAFGESLDSDPYFNNFSDGPQSRDYRHGLGKLLCILTIDFSL